MYIKEQVKSFPFIGPAILLPVNDRGPTFYVDLWKRLLTHFSQCGYDDAV